MLENFLADLKANLTASPLVKDIEIDDEFITSVSGFLDCAVELIDGSTLYVTEYFTISGEKIKRDKYSYHLQEKEEFIIRWDNAPHHRKIKTFPHHKHVKEAVLESKEVVLEEILGDVEKMMKGK